MIRVLIVDDDKLARKGLISIMPWSSHGMEVVGEAANGAKALEFLKHTRVDLMFVDLSMPVISGMDLIQQTSILYPGLNFIILTCHENFDYMQTCIRLGAIDYISKMKLEMEDYDAIFDRIQQIMLNMPQQGIHKAFHDSVEGSSQNNSQYASSDKQWSHFEEEWSTLFWLFDDIVFEKLYKELTESDIPLNSVITLLSRAITKVEELTQIKALPFFDIDSIQAAMGFVRHYRDLIYLRASQSDNLMETSICILKSVRFINDRIADQLHTELVASHVNMSRSYFCQCFKKLVGQTFNDYLRQKRIYMAKQLLSQTNQNISWISQAIGYGDIKYFSQIFREQTNMLPSEYRTQYQNGGK